MECSPRVPVEEGSELMGDEPFWHESACYEPQFFFAFLEASYLPRVPPRIPPRVQRYPLSLGKPSVLTIEQVAFIGLSIVCVFPKVPVETGPSSIQQIGEWAEYPVD